MASVLEMCTRTEFVFLVIGVLESVQYSTPAASIAVFFIVTQLRVNIDR
jgi:hypothetical protein